MHTISGIRRIAPSCDEEKKAVFLSNRRGHIANFVSAKTSPWRLLGTREFCNSSAGFRRTKKMGKSQASGFCIARRDTYTPQPTETRSKPSAGLVSLVGVFGWFAVGRRSLRLQGGGHRLLVRFRFALKKKSTIAAATDIHRGEDGRRRTQYQNNSARKVAQTMKVNLRTRVG